MTVVVDAVSAILILVGSVVVAIAGIGLVRLADPFMRMHAATKAGVVGSGLVMLGAALSLGTPGALLTAVFGVLFLLATSPVASHVLGRAAYVAGAPISRSTAVNALSGVLARSMFDAPPEQRPVFGGQVTTHDEEAPMAHALRHAVAASEPAVQAAKLRHVTVWLVGGSAQTEAIRLGVAVASASGATITGLSAIDLSAAEYRGALPIGGVHWARLLGGHRRRAMREAAAQALAEFRSVADTAGLRAATRHEEGAFETLIATIGVTDLIVVPGGIDALGRPVGCDSDLAGMIARSQVAPVMRVMRLPGPVRRVLIVVDAATEQDRLRQALVERGLWPDAAYTVVTSGPRRATVQAIAENVVDMLHVSGRSAVLGPSLSQRRVGDHSRRPLLEFDTAVLSVLPQPPSWFRTVRRDPNDYVASAVPVVLLP